MDTPDKKISELVEVVRSWIPRRAEPPNVSRDFWMPDQSCRVCYECDSQFTIFNRRHHCRICGRVFCAKCTANSVPAPSDEPKSGREDWERIRVCNYCFKQWEQGVATVYNGTPSATPRLSPSPSATSLASTKSSCTCHSSSSTAGSVPYLTGPYQRVPYSPHQSARMDLITDDQENVTSGRSTNPGTAVGDLASNQFGYCFNRSDDDDDDYSGYHSDTETRHFSNVNDYDDPVNIHGIDHVYGPHEIHHDRDNIETKGLSYLTPAQNLDLEGIDGIQTPGKEADENDRADGCETTTYDEESTNAEPVDFENNGLVWLPPDPEDEEDEREAVLFDDDDDDEGATGEWGYLRSSSSFDTGEYRSRDKSSEEHRKAMKNVVEGHFRALVAQLLQVESLPVCDEDRNESWLDIITALSWEAATLLKPDMSKGGGMDPGGYVKVKCIACGNRSESMVVKGVVCKKNVAHRRMTSKYDKPRFLILGGALEYQRVSNQLSSVDTLLQQEMDHLKMAVAKIDAHHPNVLLVEKSVSRYAQEYLLAKDISLVLNIKRPLLERIARCTGAQIVPSIDHLTSQKLGYCETFRVDKYFEEHGSAGQGGKKSTKTLMFFEGCPKPFGCTILLKGANGDELKKVKHVVQYGVFAAYHLALETSFLADEGASLPELPLKSPITVALPDKPSTIERSISTIPGFYVLAAGEHRGTEPIKELPKSNDGHKTERTSSNCIYSIDKSLVVNSTCMHSGDTIPSGQDMPSFQYKHFILNNASKEDDKKGPEEFFKCRQDERRETMPNNDLISDSLDTLDGTNYPSSSALAANQGGSLEPPDVKHDNNNTIQNDMVNSKEDFPPSTSDHQSILVFLSTRCVWKGTVCERSHLVRIKYYGSSDKPLGRFLRDQLFDQNYRCHSCEMPSEAHVHCYTHRQGSLTISVKKLPEFLLPGERDGKIWMWHRCLKCPRVNGFPPATRRVVMSDAAWGLSFGKFLELSFSNHAAASRVASCGHSLHRDCLRFYGFGKMVACFRYASIDLHSVYLPPPKLEFNHDNQDWLQKEGNEVHNRAKMLFSEVCNALHQMSEKVSGPVLQEGGDKASDFRDLIVELEGMLQKEKEEFEELLQKVLNKEVKFGQPVIDVLELNKLRRQIVIHSYVWDQRLIYASKLSKSSLQEDSRNSHMMLKDKPIASREKVVEVNVTTRPGRGHGSCDSFLLETKPDGSLNQGNTEHLSQPGEVPRGKDKGIDTSHGKVDLSLSDGVITSDKSDPLEFGGAVRRALSEGESPIMANLSDTLEAAWTGESHPTNSTHKDNNYLPPDSTIRNPAPTANLITGKSDNENYTANMGGCETGSTCDSKLLSKGLDTRWNGMPFPNLFNSFNKTSCLNTQKLVEYNPVYIFSFREFERQTGARLLLPPGINDMIVPVYDDEPTSIIAYVLLSLDYHVQVSESESSKDSGDCSISLPLFDSTSLLSLNSFDETITSTYRSFGSSDESILSTSGSRSSQVGDPLLYTKDLHARVSFTDDSSLGKVKYTVTCYYAKRFEALRRICCPSEFDFVRSLSRCKKWGAQGGKSNVFFAKTLDDRFIIKQVTKIELESFIKFAPSYFKYLSESTSSGSPTCLAKILGIYQVTSKHLKGGKETKMDVLVMENLLFRRNIRRLYDLKGSSRSRYNPDTSGSNKVLLDQNLIEAMPTSPIFVGNKAKRLLERAVWNDTSFLASIYVMDYSLLVGVDEEKHELVLGIIDFMRQYTWDKHLETWVKTSGILGGPKNSSPTVISPEQYKKRFRKAMSAYFLMVPDQWSPPVLHPSGSQSDLCDEHS